MEYDYTELKRAIRANFDTMADFARAMGMGECTLSLKLNNKAEWTQPEMLLAMELIHKPASKITTYFFKHKV